MENYNTKKHLKTLEDLKKDVSMAFNYTKVKKYVKSNDDSPFYHHIIGKDDIITLFDIFLDDLFIIINISDKVITDYCFQINNLIELIQDKYLVRIKFYKVKG